MLGLFPPPDVQGNVSLVDLFLGLHWNYWSVELEQSDINFNSVTESTYVKLKLAVKYQSDHDNLSERKLMHGHPRLNKIFTRLMIHSLSVIQNNYTGNCLGPCTQTGSICQYVQYIIQFSNRLGTHL